MTAWLFPTYQLDGFEWQHKLISLQENKFLPLLRVEKQSHAHLNYLLISSPYVSWSNENREKKFITRHSHYAFCVCVCFKQKYTCSASLTNRKSHTCNYWGWEKCTDPKDWNQSEHRDSLTFTFALWIRSLSCFKIDHTRLMIDLSMPFISLLSWTHFICVVRVPPAAV